MPSAFEYYFRIRIFDYSPTCNVDAGVCIAKVRVTSRNLGSLTYYLFSFTVFCLSTYLLSRFKFLLLVVYISGVENKKRQKADVEWLEVRVV